MLQVISQPIDQAEIEHRVPKDSKYRPWIKQRLSSNDLDVERIHANWVADGKGTENVATAIRLLDALMHGDLDAARVACPILNLILPAPESASKKNRPPSGSSNSDSERSKTIRVEDLEGGEKELALALAEVTGADLDLMDKPIARLAVKLAHCKNKYTASDVHRWYTSVWKAHWPGSKGDPCDLEHVERGIGRVKALPPEVPASAGTGAGPAAAPNRYVDDEYFTKKAEEEVFSDQDFGPEPEPRPVLVEGSDAPHSRAVTAWKVTLGQLQLQLNRSTYDTWLRHAWLVGFEKCDGGSVRLTITVPHQYAKEWIERHLLHSMARTMADIYYGFPELKGEEIKSIEIVVEIDLAR